MFGFPRLIRLHFYKWQCRHVHDLAWCWRGGSNKSCLMRFEWSSQQGKKTHTVSEFNLMLLKRPAGGCRGMLTGLFPVGEHNYKRKGFLVILFLTGKHRVRWNVLWHDTHDKRKVQRWPHLRFGRTSVAVDTSRGYMDIASCFLPQNCKHVVIIYMYSQLNWLCIMIETRTVYWNTYDRIRSSITLM